MSLLVNLRRAATAHEHAADTAGALLLHGGEADPHAQYQKEADRGQPGGYAALDETGKVPAAQLPAAEEGGVTDHGQLTGLADDDHPQYALDADLTAHLTPDAHHARDHALVGATHTASGLTAGHVLRATAATTFAFGAIQDADLPASIARDAEMLAAVAAEVDAHESLADPHTGYQKESEKGAANGYAPLDSGLLVPIANIPTGTTGTTVALGNHTHAGGSTPAWATHLHAAWGDGDPEGAWWMLNAWGAGTTALTPTGVTATVGRVWIYRSPYAITVNRIRWFAVAGTATASNFRLGIWNADGLSQHLAPQTLTFTGTDRWTSHAATFTLAANTRYYFCLSATATSTVWSLKASAIPATFPHLDASSPGNLAIANARHEMWFGQTTVVAGVQPAVMPALARGSGWTVGGVPTFLLDNNSAA